MKRAWLAGWAAGILVMTGAAAAAERPLVADLLWLRSADYHGVELRDGTPAYTDRGFPLVNVPKELLGATYVQFANDLRTSTTVGTQVRLAGAATVYLLYDGRAEPPADWVKAQGFPKTELSLTVGANEEFPFHAYKKDVDGGVVRLGPSRDEAGHGANMYGLAFRDRRATVEENVPLVAEVAYATAEGFHGFVCEKDVQVYWDRGFRLKDAPEPLAGAVWLPSIHAAGASSKVRTELELAQPATVYLAIKDPPGWVEKDGFKPVGVRLTVTGLDRSPDIDLNVYSRQAAAGRIVLGPNSEDARPKAAMYVVAVSGTAEQNKVGVRSGRIVPRQVITPPNPRTVWCDDADGWAVSVWAGNSSIGPGFVQGPLRETTAPGGLMFLEDGRAFGAVGCVITTIRDGGQWVFAGVPGVNGHRDGMAKSALFGGIGGLAFCKGDFIVLDSGNLCFRRVTKEKDGGWVVSTIAGVPGKQGHQDGMADKALFNHLWSMTVDKDGRIYAFDDNWLRRIADGKVETLNAKGGGGYKDGPLADARFSISPGGGSCMDEHGVIYLADRINRCIRRIDLAKGEVTTVAGQRTLNSYHDGPALLTGFGDSPGHVVYCRVRKCYYTNGVDESCIRRMEGGWIKTLAGNGRALTGPAKDMAMTWGGVCGIDLLGDLYVHDSAHPGIIRKLTFVGKKEGK